MRLWPMVRTLRFLWVLLVGVLLFSGSGHADTTWHVWVGAQSKDLGRQALAFLPNEIWIHQDDSITFHWTVDEPHTVTFMTAGQVRLPFPMGCGGGTFSTSPATFDGTKCVSAPPLTEPATFTVRFTGLGNFKVVCLLHPDMTGTVHVLKSGAALPHDQRDYAAQAVEGAEHLLSEADHDAHAHHADRDDRDALIHGPHVITVGDGEVLASAGGRSTAALMRFTDSTITIPVGGTVEWQNHDPATPHTITFGVEPPEPALQDPSADVTTDPDGARHATLSGPGANTHSGFIMGAPEEEIGSPTPPLGPVFVSRFRVTFKAAGVYPFICALHDGLGMKGQIIVK